MYDVAVIGAGVIGTLTARELARYKLKTVLLEKENDVAMGTSKANSAIVHAGFDAKVGSEKARLNVLGSQMMESVAKELGVKYLRNGSLVLGFSEADMKTVRELYERGVANGVKELEILGRDALRALEPNIGDEAVGALYAKTGAIICPYGLAIAACGNAMDNGVALRCNFGVTSIRREADGYCLRSGEDEVRARFVVNAAGLYADAVADMAEKHTLTIRPRKGEYFVMDKSLGGLVRSTVFVTPSAMGKGILVSPTVDGNLLVGPTAEDIDDKTDLDTTDDGGALIRAQASRSVKNVDFRKVITSFAGLRAVGDAGDFVISAEDGFVSAAGIESPGLSASPAIAREIVQKLAGMGLTLEENPAFCPTRRPADWFRTLSAEEKNDVIRRDPAYGRIVCRCEEVTEGEIIEALSVNPPANDLDGVKRRTRSGMGRCQDGFCSPNVTELIAGYRKIPYEDVTKFGKESKINLGKLKGGARHA